jgi:hypothetical protein
MATARAGGNRHPAHRARLDLEAAEGVGRGGELLEQELDRDRATELDPFAAIDRAHGAVPDPLDDSVALVQHGPDAWVGPDHLHDGTKAGAARPPSGPGARLHPDE